MNKEIQKPRGAVAVIVAFFLLVLFGFLGLAVDVGYAHVQKTRLQAVADAQALACAINPSRCGTGGENPFPETNPARAQVRVIHPVACPNLTTQQGCAQATASAQWGTFFMGLLGKPTAAAQAVAIAGRNARAPSCVTTLNSFSANGGNIITLSNCSADIGGTLSSTNRSGIQVASGSTGSISVYNSNPSDQCGNCSPAPIGLSSPLPSLPSSTIPTTNFDGQPLIVRSGSSCTSGTCQPGIYSSLVKLSGTTTFASGNYVFNGGLDTNNRTVTSESGGVSLYIPGSQNLLLSGNVTLTAPTPAGCAVGSGVVISHPLSGAPRNLDLNGSKVTLRLTGVVNLSADKITISGSSSSFTLNGTLVANSVILNGNMFPNISANPCNNLYQSAKITLLQ
jgi:Putative Flp pilus-assembly TadE/G-like